jgi:hypothetical protein
MLTRPWHVLSHISLQVTRIQKHVRRYVVQRFYKEQQRRSNVAVIKLQSAVRGWCARRLRDQYLWERETFESKDSANVIIAELEWIDREMDNCAKVGVISSMGALHDCFSD